MASTAAYDLTLLQGLQSGKPLPAERWASLTAPTLVLTGEKSEAFFHSGAKALAGALAHAEHACCPASTTDPWRWRLNRSFKH